LVGDGKIVAGMAAVIIILALFKQVGWAALCGAIAAANPPEAHEKDL
jgi:hypothetical protein